MTMIYLIRHGETDWNVLGRFQGQADPPLNSTGIAQSEELAASLRGEKIDVIYTSPLKRALQTAEILSQRLSVELIIDPRLMEIHQGDWQTRLRPEIEAVYAELFAEWETNPWDVSPPGGESLAEVQARVKEAMGDILENHPRKHIAIVSHRIPIALIKVQYQGLDKDIVRKIKLPNSSWEKIEIDSPSKAG